MESSYSTQLKEALSYETIAKELFENYESLYSIDVETSAFQCYHESDSFSTLKLESRGDDFFDTIEGSLIKSVHPDDREYVRTMLSEKALIEGLRTDKYHTLIYRVMIGGKPLYHKLRATKAVLNDRPHYILGVRNVDAPYRQMQEHARELSAMQKKERIHLDAILAGAEGYIEANITKDCILELSEFAVPAELPEGVEAPFASGSMAFSELEEWFADNLIVKNKEKFEAISNRNYLIRCFERGERRASVSFSMKTAAGRIQACKKVFYLYKDEAAKDIMAFCVIYDLTEQQHKEKELRELERELQMSRIRNFTSQMQPHFLYNALGSIQEVVMEDPQYASELIGDFTVHLRSCIRAMANDTLIPFDQELANVKAYINIERMRFGEKLKVNYDIQTSDFLMLPLTVQPIVENAIRHGIYQRGVKGGTVELKTRMEKDARVIEICDDGVGFDVEAYHAAMEAGSMDSTGIKNIQFRLDKVMGAEMEIKSDIDKGTCVTIRIPKTKLKNEEAKE